MTHRRRCYSPFNSFLPINNDRIGHGNWRKKCRREVRWDTGSVRRDCVTVTKKDRWRVISQFTLNMWTPVSSRGPRNLEISASERATTSPTAAPGGSQPAGADDRHSFGYAFSITSVFNRLSRLTTPINDLIKPFFCNRTICLSARKNIELVRHLLEYAYE